MFSFTSVLSEVRVVLILQVKCGVCFVVFVAPESYKELKSLLSGKPVEEQLLVVERIQKCNHPSLAVGNKAKLEVSRSGLHREWGAGPWSAARGGRGVGMGGEPGRGRQWAHAWPHGLQQPRQTWA